MGLLCFQLSDDGQIILILPDCKILKQCDRNRASAFRKLLALLYSVIALETEIRMHQMSVVLLTDAIFKLYSVKNFGIGLLQSVQFLTQVHIAFANLQI